MATASPGDASRQILKNTDEPTHQRRVAALVASDRELYERIIRLREFSTVFTHSSLEFDRRIYAFARLFVNVLELRPQPIHDLARTDAVSYIATVHKYVAQLRSLAHSESSARIEADAVDNLFDLNLEFGDTYLWQEDERPKFLPDYHADGLHLDSLLRRVLLYLRESISKPQRAESLVSSVQVAKEARRTLRILESGDSAAKRAAREQVLDVEIYLADANLPVETLQPVEDAVTDFLRAMGAPTSTGIETQYGSIRRRIIAFFSRQTTQDEIQDAYHKGKQALHNALLEKPRSEIIDKMAGAASQLLGSLNGVENAMIRVGELLVVKRTADGVASIAIETISAHLAHALEERPALLRHPDELFALLKSTSAHMAAELPRIGNSD